MSNSRHGGCLIDRRHKGLPCWKCHADCVNILSTSSCCLTQNAVQFDGISLRNVVHTEMSKVKIGQFRTVLCWRSLRDISNKANPFDTYLSNIPCVYCLTSIAKFLTNTKNVIEMEDSSLPKIFCP